MHIYLCQIDPLQLSIDLYKTITPHKFPPPPIKHRSLQYIYIYIYIYIYMYIYSTMHIYLWQIHTTPSPPIKHRCLENHYTK